jgi:hypothetical protein
MLEKTKDDVEQLHIDCVRTLRAYITEANQTCKLLTEIKDFPIPTEKRLEMLEQRRRENLASERYQEARQRLFKAAQWDL